MVCDFNVVVYYPQACRADERNFVYRAPDSVVNTLFEFIRGCAVFDIYIRALTACEIKEIFKVFDVVDTAAAYKIFKVVVTVCVFFYIDRYFRLFNL